MMLLTTIMMMTMISAMMIITKYSLPTIDFATRYATRYSDFLLQPYSNPTRSKKTPTRLCLIISLSSPIILPVQFQFRCTMHTLLIHKMEDNEDGEISSISIYVYFASVLPVHVCQLSVANI